MNARDAATQASEFDRHSNYTVLLRTHPPTLGMAYRLLGIAHWTVRDERHDPVQEQSLTGEPGLKERWWSNRRHRMMAAEDGADLTRLERMEQRLRVLEDAEAIRNLKARYAALCDDHYDADGIAALFTEDALWESPALGRFQGREAIRGFFRGASGIFSFAIHYSLNGSIEVEGDTARARWYLFMPCTVAAANQAMWRAGIDHETYARVDGIWMFRHKRSEPLMNAPFETGWARTRFA
jgi:ketosteroid isomerase-like protein